MRQAYLLVSACFLTALDGHAAAAVCVAQGGTGLESIQGERASSHVYAGAQLQLQVGVHKGAGERVDTQATLASLSSAKVELLKLGWLVPAVGSVMAPSDTGSAEVRDVMITLVSAPGTAGDQEATLPPLPVVIRQTSGAKVTLCTSEHKTTVHDPTDQNAKAPRNDAPPLPEFETWMAARWAIAGFCVTAPLLLWLARWWLRRRALKMAARRRPQPTPYQRAGEALAELRTQDGMPTDWMADTATDAFRSYLAEAHSLRALECTTAELLARIAVSESTRCYGKQTEAWLTDADAMKFAARQLTHAERTDFLSSGAELLAAWENAP